MKYLGLQQTPCPGSGSALNVCLQYLRRRLIYKSAEDEMNREVQTPRHSPGCGQWPGPGWLRVPARPLSSVQCLCPARGAVLQSLLSPLAGRSLGSPPVGG